MTEFATPENLKSITYYKAPTDGRVVAIHIRADFDEFESLVVSSGLIIHGSKCLKQTAPVINTFITKGNLENLRNQIIQSDVEIIIISW